MIVSIIFLLILNKVILDGYLLILQTIPVELSLPFDLHII